MTSRETCVPRLVSMDRRQMLRRTVDVEKLVDDDHCVRAIRELVGRLDFDPGRNSQDHFTVSPDGRCADYQAQAVVGANSGMIENVR